MNLKLSLCFHDLACMHMRPADFNSKLREQGVDRKVTVQKICRVCKDEKQTRTLLDGVWSEPGRGMEFSLQVSMGNEHVFKFEKTLEQ